LNNKEIRQYIISGGADEALSGLYGEDKLQEAKARCIEVCDGFDKRFGEGEDMAFFSSPGRTEIGGNHTDHNHGCVLAAAIDMDIVAAASPTAMKMVSFKSQGFPEYQVDLSTLLPQNDEKGLSSALIRGVADGLVKNGYKAYAFDAYSTSKVLKGSGVSSSAAFELLTASIFNFLFNKGEISPETCARVSQYAEQKYFGKPSGLMDQLSCAVGGFVFMDFADPEMPKIRRLSYDLTNDGYTLCVINTGGSHHNLTDDYAYVGLEMRSVAKALGCSYLAETSLDRVMENISDIRSRCGDRAVMRAIHFFEENERVKAQAKALDEGDFESFLDVVNESGLSSALQLQNSFSPSEPSEQGIPLALSITKRFLGKKGACRVHGGGFAGTIQAYIPTEILSRYSSEMNSVFGEGACIPLKVRAQGSTKIF